MSNILKEQQIPQRVLCVGEGKSFIFKMAAYLPRTLVEGTFCSYILGVLQDINLARPDKQICPDDAYIPVNTVVSSKLGASCNS